MILLTKMVIDIVIAFLFNRYLTSLFLEEAVNDRDN